MTIANAVTLAMHRRNIIYRKCIPKVVYYLSTPIEISVDGGRTFHYWNPTAEDLTAEDWEVGT